MSIQDIYDDDVVSLLESKGFDKIEDSEYAFKHEDVIIRFMCTKEDIIYQISVSLVSTCDVIF